MYETTIRVLTAYVSDSRRHHRLWFFSIICTKLSPRAQTKHRDGFNAWQLAPAPHAACLHFTLCPPSTHLNLISSLTCVSVAHLAFWALPPTTRGGWCGVIKIQTRRRSKEKNVIVPLGVSLSRATTFCVLLYFKRKNNENHYLIGPRVGRQNRLFDFALSTQIISARACAVGCNDRPHRTPTPAPLQWH